MSNWYTGELPEKVWKDIPNFNPPRKIVKNYTPDQQGQDIRPQDIVRPINKKWAKGDEVQTWRKLSNERAPTYRSCTMCFRSGPLGRLCNKCNYENNHYVALNYDNGHGQGATLDSVTMSEIFRAGNETAKADRDILWLRTPSDKFTMLMIDSRLSKICGDIYGEDNSAHDAEKKRIVREVREMIDLDN